jgi:hypothetical protein
MQSHPPQERRYALLSLAGQHLPDRRRQIGHGGIQANAPGRIALETRFSVIRRLASIYQRYSGWHIESVFATVKHRTVRMKGALSQDTARLMVFKLVMAASRTWRRLQGQNQLPKVINGVKFKDGIEAVAEIKSAA